MPSIPNLATNAALDAKINEVKVGLSPSKNFLLYLLHWKPFKKDEKCFLFHLKSPSGSQDI